MIFGRVIDRILGAFLIGILVPSFVYAEVATSTDNSANISNITATSTPVGSNTPLPPKPVHNAKEVEKQVREYFSGIPVMIEIARCESKFRQFADSGNPFHGGMGGNMVGIFQIYEMLHEDAAEKLGFDITTVEGNIGYAHHLYKQSGTKPWMSSFPCWNTGTPQPSAASDLTALSFGMIDDRVRKLQEMLNGAGYTLASEGPGSPGNETSKFGFLTLEAVKKFQCKENIACSGDEYTTGYGFVGDKTWNALLEAQTKQSTHTTQIKDEEVQKQIETLIKLISELQKLLAEMIASEAQKTS